MHDRFGPNAETKNTKLNGSSVPLSGYWSAFCRSTVISLDRIVVSSYFKTLQVIL